MRWRLFAFILIVTHAGFFWPPYPAEAGEAAVAERAIADGR